MFLEKCPLSVRLSQSFCRLNDAPNYVEFLYLDLIFMIDYVRTFKFCIAPKVHDLHSEDVNLILSLMGLIIFVNNGFNND